MKINDTHPAVGRVVERRAHTNPGLLAQARAIYQRARTEHQDWWDEDFDLDDPADYVNEIFYRMGEAYGFDTDPGESDDNLADTIYGLMFHDLDEIHRQRELTARAALLPDLEARLKESSRALIEMANFGRFTSDWGLSFDSKDDMQRAWDLLGQHWGVNRARKAVIYADTFIQAATRDVQREMLRVVSARGLPGSPNIDEPGERKIRHVRRREDENQTSEFVRELGQLAQETQEAVPPMRQAVAYMYPDSSRTSVPSHELAASIVEAINRTGHLAGRPFDNEMIMTTMPADQVRLSEFPVCNIRSLTGLSETWYFVGRALLSSLDVAELHRFSGELGARATELGETKITDIQTVVKAKRDAEGAQIGDALRKLGFNVKHLTPGSLSWANEVWTDAPFAVVVDVATKLGIPVNSHDTVAAAPPHDLMKLVVIYPTSSTMKFVDGELTGPDGVKQAIDDMRDAADELGRQVESLIEEAPRSDS